MMNWTKKENISSNFESYAWLLFQTNAWTWQHMIHFRKLYFFAILFFSPWNSYIHLTELCVYLCFFLLVSHISIVKIERIKYRRLYTFFWHHDVVMVQKFGHTNQLVYDMEYLILSLIGYSTSLFNVYRCVRYINII